MAFSTTAGLSSKISVRGASAVRTRRTRATVHAPRSGVRVVAFKEGEELKAAIKETLAQAKLLPTSTELHACPFDLTRHAADDLLFQPNGQGAWIPFNKAQLDATWGPGGAMEGNRVQVHAHAINGRNVYLYCTEHRPNGDLVKSIARIRCNGDGLFQDLWANGEYSNAERYLLNDNVADELINNRAAVNPRAAAVKELSTARLQPGATEAMAATLDAFIAAWRTTGGEYHLDEIDDLVTPDFAFICNDMGPSPDDPVHTAASVKAMWRTVVDVGGRPSQALLQAFAAGPLADRSLTTAIAWGAIVSKDFATHYVEPPAFSEDAPVAFLHACYTGANADTGELASVPGLNVFEFTPDGKRITKCIHHHSPCSHAERAMMFKLGCP